MRSAKGCGRRRAASRQFAKSDVGGSVAEGRSNDATKVKIDELVDGVLVPLLGADALPGSLASTSWLNRSASKRFLCGMPDPLRSGTQASMLLQRNPPSQLSRWSTAKITSASHSVVIKNERTAVRANRAMLAGSCVM